MIPFLLLMLGYALSQFGRGFLAVVAVDVGRDTGMSPADLAGASSVWFGAFAVGQVPVGLALDRLGPRRVLAGFLGFSVAGGLVLANATAPGTVRLAMGLIGLGCAPALMGGLYLFGRLYPQERFAMLASLLIGCGAGGDILSSAPLALAAHAFGWRPILVGFAVASALVALATLATLRDPPPLPAPARAEGVLHGLLRVARLPDLRPILPLVFVSYAVVIATRSLWVGAYLQAVHGLDAVARGNATLAMSVAMAAGAMAYGPLERALGDPKRTALGGCALTAAAFLALALAGGRSTALAVALFALVGAAGLSYAILMAHARRFFPAHLLGRGVTFVNVVFMGGASAVQALSAAFAARSAAPPETTYAHLFLAYGLALAGATAVYLRARPAPEPLPATA